MSNRFNSLVAYEDDDMVEQKLNRDNLKDCQSKNDEAETIVVSNNLQIHNRSFKTRQS